MSNNARNENWNSFKRAWYNKELSNESFLSLAESLDRNYHLEETVKVKSTPYHDTAVSLIKGRW